MDLLIVVDYTTPRDARVRSHTGDAVILDAWRPGVEVFGWGPWHRIKKHALFPFGKNPNKTAVHRAKERVQKIIAEHQGFVVILQTPGAGSGEETQHTAGSLAWSALSPPDTIDNMFGTYWNYGAATIMACPTLYRRQSQLQRWELGQFLERAQTRPAAPLPSLTALHPGDTALGALSALADAPLSIDVETIPSTQTITAINLAARDVALSLPWDAYDTPDGTHVRQLPVALQRQVTALLAAPTTKIGHNIAFDRSELQAKNLPLAGNLADTMLMSRILTPELTHGLQKVTARWLPCPPWKSTFKPQGLRPGVHKDHPDYWRTDPEGLRIYGAQDAWFTLQLAQTLAPKLGIKL